jgi:acyl-coenzyme A synthetase/AMP-(fatty) acid ligase
LREAFCQEFIKVRGFQVAPAELEGSLLGHPDIVDCCVVGVEDEYSGELPLAFVVLSADARRRSLEGPQAAANIRRSIQHVSIPL